MVAPFPNNPHPMSQFDVQRDFDIKGDGIVWYARPQLFFSCTVCPAGAQDEPRQHTKLDLVFFTTFEPIMLTPGSIMQSNGVPMVYEAARNQIPSLYVAPVENMLGRVPLIPCFLEGQAVNTIPHSYRGHCDLSGATADSRPGAGNGATLWEVHIWMWRYGRSLPRTTTIEEATARRAARLQDSRKRAAATKKRRREEAEQRHSADSLRDGGAAVAADAGRGSGSESED